MFFCMMKTSRKLLKLSFRESKGWLPEGENTLCFKSNNPAAAAESNDAAASAAA